MTHRNSNPKEPLTPHPIPEYPWQVVGTDLFQWDNKEFLVVVDYYSKFFEVVQLNSTSSKAIINHMKAIFARFGIPEKVISDNGPQYSSHEFENFAKAYDFVHSTSSPRYPQSNGLAECTVQTVKHIFEKANSSKKDPYLGILEYRNTPLQSTGLPPSELLQGRLLRSVLPTLTNQLKPKFMNSTLTNQSMKLDQQRQAKYYNVSSKAQNQFNVGEKVRFQKNDSKWQPAIITGKEDDHSYTLRSQYGGIFRRNRRHLIKSNEDFDISLSPSYKVYDDNPIPSKTLVNSPKVKFDIPKDDPKVKDTTHKDQVQPPPVVKYEPIHTQGHSQPYITRSGRIVKPKIIKSM